ncbi:MAG: aldo/keto reductase [Verrucomicrobiota bacterium]
MKSSPDERYSRISYRRCGASGLKLPLLSLGFWQSLGDPGNEAECRRCMYAAFDQGITHFDLANNYGSPAGNAEWVVGKILKDMPREELIISTKAGWGMWYGPYGSGGSRKYLISSVDQSLQRLGLDYVDIFYHHVPDLETPVEETLMALEQIVRQGKALYVGVSSYSGALFRKSVEFMKERNGPPITVHQPSYSMLRRTIEKDLLPHTAEMGTGVIAFCPLYEGLLTSRYLNGLPEGSRLAKSEEGRKRYENLKADGTLNRLQQLNCFAAERGQTLAQLALLWVLRDPRITSALIGVSQVHQLLENLKALEAPALSVDECAQIEVILKT